MQRLKELRKEKGLSQKNVADFIGKTYQAYSNYESGKREPDIETLKQLSHLFGVSVDYLIENDTDNGTHPPQCRERLISKLLAADIVTAAEVEEYLDYKEYKKRKKDQLPVLTPVK